MKLATVQHLRSIAKDVISVKNPLDPKGPELKFTPNMNVFLDNGLYCMEGTWAVYWDDANELLYYVRPNSGVNGELRPYLLYCTEYENIQAIYFSLNPSNFKEMAQKAGFDETLIQRAVNIVEGKLVDTNNNIYPKKIPEVQSSFSDNSTEYNHGDH